MLLKYNNVEILQDNVTILTNINLTINEGDYVFVTGKVGSGKSTFISTIYGELIPAKGEALVLEYDMKTVKNKQISPLRKQLGIVFQNFELLIDRTVFKNLEFVLKATGWKNKQEINQRISEVLNKVEMLDKMDKYPYELSGGEQQRVAIARALLNKPKLIVADEPTGNLDMESSMSIVKLLNEIREEGTAIIMSTHNLQLIDLVPDASVYNCNNKTITPIKIAEPKQCDQPSDDAETAEAAQPVEQEEAPVQAEATEQAATSQQAETSECADSDEANAPATSTQSSDNTSNNE